MNVSTVTRKPFYTIILLCLTFHATAQPSSTDPRHENHYRARPIETKDLKIEFENFHAQQAFTLVNMKVTNKTSGHILVVPSEITFRYDFGEYHPAVSGVSSLLSGATMLLEAGESSSRALKVSGGENFHVERLVVLFKGFYKISSAGVPMVAPQFQLPASANSFSAGGFECSLDKLKKETKETNISFRCIYNGDNVGIVEPDKITLQLENESEFANDTKRGKRILLFKGDDTKLAASFHVSARIVDMQFANMSLLWDNVFTESKMVTMQIPDMKATLDPGMTDGKNR